MLRRMFPILAALVLGGLISPCPADDLPRKPWLGTAIRPANGGTEVLEILPASTAASIGLEAGDLILAVGDMATPTPAEVTQALSARRAGEDVLIRIRRGKEEFAKAVTLVERPRESSEDYDVEYGSVESRGARLRTIVTTPKGDGKHPAVLVIQGLGAYSIDNQPGGLAVYRAIPDTLTRAGMVTLRVDKPGTGDSEGGPCSEIDFETELDAYRQALKALKSRDDVDADHVFLFGHSMGGVMAPVLAREIPVDGICVYGTTLKNWTEYLLENTRRQMHLAGESHADIDRANRDQLKFLHYFADEKLTPSKIAEAHSDLAELVNAQYADGVHQFGRHYRFFHQLHDLNLAEQWENVDADVLAVWGEADFVSGADDHAAIAEIANVFREGKGRYVELEDSTHGFETADDERAAVAMAGQPGVYNPAFATLLRNWVLEVSKSD